MALEVVQTPEEEIVEEPEEVIEADTSVVVQEPAVFCRLDPFHTIITLFLSGSVIVAGVMLFLSVFVRRFFCRYLCFLGAALNLFTPLRLYSRMTGKKQVKRNCEL